MIVFGLTATSIKRSVRAAAIVKMVKERLGLKAQLVMVDSFLQATVRALEEAGRGVVATIAGSIDDIQLPPDHDGFGRTEWQESWLRFLEEHHIAFMALPGAPTQPEAGATASIIRSYNRAASALAESVRKLQSDQRRDRKQAEGGYVCGRPPYGYSVRNGTFVINNAQAEAVTLIFTTLRDGKTIRDVISLLRRKHSQVPGERTKRQFWDRVKIHRILGHRRLYCLGQYKAGERGQQDRNQALAFLPPEWVDTQPTKVNPPAAAAAT